MDLDAALASSLARFPDLGAYALCTDDCLSTLFASAAPRAWLATASPDEQLLPSEWPLADEDSFAAASALLRARYEAAPDFSAHVTASFAELVAALARAPFPPGVIRLATSTDAGPHLARLAADAARALNDAALYERFCAATGVTR